MLLASVPDELWIIIALPIICGSLIALTAIITDHKRKSQRDDMEATLKMEMLQRGLSADEIERVLSARFGGSRRGPRKSDERTAEGQQPARGRYFR